MGITSVSATQPDLVHTPTIVAGAVAALVAAVGWVIAHHFNVRRDALQKRRDLRTEYLMESYRRLGDLAGRFGADVAQMQRAFESAVLDIQLLGTRAQIDTLLAFLRAFTENPNIDLAPLFQILRDELRRELGLDHDVPQLHFFRFNQQQAAMSAGPGAPLPPSSASSAPSGSGSR